MSVPETAGNLESGGRFRATGRLLELTTPDGTVAATFDISDFTSVSRAGSVINLQRSGHGPVTINTASLDDAGRLEAALRIEAGSALVASPSGSASPRSGGARRFFLWGCLGTIGLIVLIGIIAALAGGGENDDDGVVAVQPTDLPTTAATSTEPLQNAATETDVDSTSPANVGESPTQDDETTTVAETPTQEATQAPEETATSVATPEPSQAGAGRDNPIPVGSIGTTDDWEMQIIEAVRGDAAYSRLLEVNQFNEPAPEGFEYVLLNIRVKYLGSDTEAQDMNEFWFRTTGDARVKHEIPSVVDPAPELDASLFTGGEATGWGTYLARQGETNLMAVFEPFLSFEDEQELFLAIDDGATIANPGERLADENDLGFDRADPVPLGERIVGETWEVRVIESVRGEEALRRIKEENQFNEDPQPGMEYVLVHIGARNVGTESGDQSIEEFSFKLTGDAGRVYDMPSVVDPQPDFSFEVYPGGEVDGWITLTCAENEQNLKVVYEPAFSFSADPRYLSIQ
jgi:hypothetical protein